MQVYPQSLPGRFAPVVTILIFGTLTSIAHAQVQKSGNDVYFLGGTNLIDATNAVAGSAYVGKDINGHFSDNQNHPYNPTVNLINGGSVAGNFISYNSSIVNMSGGTNNGLDVHNLSTVNMSGGTDNADLNGYDFSTINLSGGNVAGSLIAWGNDTINITGGHVSSGFSALNGSVTNWRGGTVDLGLTANNTSVINIYGSGLTAMLASDNGVSTYTLSGMLADMTTLSNEQIQVGDKTLSNPNQNAAINIYNAGSGIVTTLHPNGQISTAPVPEMSSVLTMLLGLSLPAAGFLAHKRRQ